jgi:starvation-inducible DNA-binding protein
MNAMYDTRNDLSPAVRKEIVVMLNARLAEAIDLALQAKQAHWNVKGPQFISLHELFDQVNGAAREWGDQMAERAVQLGGIAEGTLQRVAECSALPAYGSKPMEGYAHVSALGASMGVFAKAVRAAIAQAEDAGDAGTADLFTGVSRGADKMLWFLEAHLQSPR